MEHSKTLDFKKAIKTTWPILLGFWPIGMALGLLAYEKGLPPFGVLLMSVIVFAGSSEFVGLSMMVAQESLAEIAIATFFINFRHIFYGMSVRNKLPTTIFSRIYCIGTLCDETYSLLSISKDKSTNYHKWISLLNHSYWFVSVWMGYFIGSGLKISIEGLDFCLTALFAVLAIEQWHIIHKRFPFVLALLIGVPAMVYFPGQMIVISILCCTGVFYIMSHFKAFNLGEYQ